MRSTPTASPPLPRIPPPVTVTDPNSSLQSKDAVERALAVSAVAWQQFITLSDASDAVVPFDHCGIG